MPDFSDSIKGKDFGASGRIDLGEIAATVTALSGDSKIGCSADVVAFLEQAVPKSKHQNVYVTGKEGRLNVKFETVSPSGERYQHGFYFVDPRVYAVATAEKKAEDTRKAAEKAAKQAEARREDEAAS